MADLDELDLIMARLANQASSGPSASTTATANTVSTATQNIFNNVNNNNNKAKQQTVNQQVNSDDDSSDDDVLAALGKGPADANKMKKQKTTVVGDVEKAVADETQEEQQQRNEDIPPAKQERQKYASDSVISRVLQDEERIGSLLSSHLSLHDEVHLASRSHNAFSDGDRTLRLEKWKQLSGGPLNPANLSGSSSLSDAFDASSLARYAEVYLEAWTLDSDSFLLRRARSILVSEMLFLLELERDEGRRRVDDTDNNDNNLFVNKKNTTNTSNSMASSSHQANLFTSINTKQGDDNNNNNNTTSNNNTNQSTEEFRRIKQSVKENQSSQPSFEDTHFNNSSSSALPPPRTLDFTPSSKTAQECLRLIHHDRFASPTKWLFLLKEIRNLPLSKVRHVWQYAIKTFPSTTWLVKEYLQLEIDAEKQLFDQVVENMNNEATNNNNNINDAAQKNLANQEEWLAVLTSRLRILDTFESHLRVCVGSAQLHAMFLRYAAETVGTLDQLTKLQLSYKCIHQVGRCFDAYVLWREVLKNRRGLVDERSVNETRRIFHRLLETPMDDLEQGKVEYLDFESKVGNNASGGGSSSATGSLPNHLNQAYRSAVDEFGERKRHWDKVAQRQKWLGNLTLRSSQEQLRLQSAARLLAHQQSISATGKPQLASSMPTNSAATTTPSFTANNAMLHGRNADRTASLAAVTINIGADEGKIPVADVEEAVANALPMLPPVHPDVALNNHSGNNNNSNSDYSSPSYYTAELFLRKKLLELEKMKGYDVLMNPADNSESISANQFSNSGGNSAASFSLYEENEAMIEFLFGEVKATDNNNNSDKNSKTGSTPSPSPALSASSFESASALDSNNNENNDDDNDNDIFDDFDDEEETNSTNKVFRNKKSHNATMGQSSSSKLGADFSASFYGSSSSGNKTSASKAQKLALQEKKRLYQNARENLPIKYQLRKRMEALADGNRLLGFHSAWDSLIELETQALKTILDNANNNMSASGALGGSNAQTIVQLINNATASAETLRQIATRCKKISLLWEQRCRSEPYSSPSHWLMWARSRFHFSVAKMKLSMEVMSEEERRKDLEEVFGIYSEAITRFPDNLVLLNSLCDILTSYGDSATANSMFFALSQHCVNQAKLLFLYEQEANLEVKILFSSDDDGGDQEQQNHQQRQRQQLASTQQARVKTLINLMKNRNMQVFCEVVEQQQSTHHHQQQKNNTTEEEATSSALDEDAAAAADQQAQLASSLSGSSSSQQQKLITLNQYLTPLGWRFCDRPRFSDSVIGSVLANPFEPASNSLLHSLSFPLEQQIFSSQLSLYQQRKQIFESRISNYLSSLRNQLKDNITLANVNWMKWLLRSKNTRFWTRSVTGYSEVDAVLMSTNNNHNEEVENNQDQGTNEKVSSQQQQQDSSLLHMRSVARYTMSKCGIARHSLFLHSWAKLEASCGSQDSAASAVEAICLGWKKNIINSIVGIAKQIKQKLLSFDQSDANLNENDESRETVLFRKLSQLSEAVRQVISAKSNNSNNNPSLLTQCGADGLFFDTLRTLDILKSASVNNNSKKQNNNNTNNNNNNNSTSNSSSFLVENSFRAELANVMQVELIENVLVDFLSSTTSNSSSVLANALKNFTRMTNNSKDESFSSMLIDRADNFTSYQQTPLTPLQIIQQSMPSVFSIAEEVRSLFVQAQSYRQIRLSSSGSNSNNNLLQQIMNFATASKTAVSMRSSLNDGEIALLQNATSNSASSSSLMTQQQEEAADMMALASPDLITQNNNNNSRGIMMTHNQQDTMYPGASSLRPNFNHFAKFSDGHQKSGIRLTNKIASTRGYVMLLEDENTNSNNNNSSLAAAFKLKKRANKKKKDDASDSSASGSPNSAAASPLQFILPHLAHQQPSNNANNLNKNKPQQNQSKQTAAQLRQQHYAEQQMKMIQSTLSSRGATDFYSTILLDIHRRTHAWGWESVLMRLLAGPPTRAERAKPPEQRAAEESLAIFKSTLPIFHKSRTANAGLMNVALSKQSDRDSDAIVADLALENERTFEDVMRINRMRQNNNQNNNQNTKNGPADRCAHLSDEQAKQNSIRSSNLMKMMMMATSEDGNADDDEEDDDDELINNEDNNNNETDDMNLILLREQDSATAFDAFAGKFSSNALFRLIHRLPSAHGLGYEPALSIIDNSKLKKKNGDGDDDEKEEEQEEEEFDFVKSAFHSTLARDEAKKNQEESLDQKYPTTKFVFEALLKTF